MDKIQAKAAKAVNALMIHDKRKKKKNAKAAPTKPSQSNPEKAAKTPAIAVQLSAYPCSYCRKAFASPNYLVKHMARRHSDKLLEMHGHYRSHIEKPQEPSLRQSHLSSENSSVGDRSHSTRSLAVTVPKTVVENTDNVALEIDDLKRFFVSVKFEIANMLQMAETKCKRREDKNPSSSDVGEKAMVESKTHVQPKTEVQCCTNSAELTELRSMCKSTKEAVQDLDERHNSLLKIVNEDLKEMLDKNEVESAKMLKELKTLRLEVAVFKEKACSVEQQLELLKSSFHDEIQHQNEELDLKLQQLSQQQAADVQNLCAHFEEHFAKVNTDLNKDIEDRFEQCLEHYLSKLPKPNKVPEKTTAVISSLPRGTEIKKVGHRNIKSYTKYPLSLKRAKAYLEQHPSGLRKGLKPVEDRVNDMMQEIGVPPECNSLTSKELVTKSRLAKNSMKHLQSKYKDFPLLCKKIEQRAQQKAQSIMAERGHNASLVSNTSVPYVPGTSQKRTYPKQVVFSEESPTPDSPIPKPAVQSSFEFVVQETESGLSLDEAHNANKRSCSGQEHCVNGAGCDQDGSFSASSGNSENNINPNIGDVAQYDSNSDDASGSNVCEPSTPAVVEKNRNGTEPSPLFAQRNSYPLNLHLLEQPKQLDLPGHAADEESISNLSALQRSDSGSTLESLELTDNDDL